MRSHYGRCIRVFFELRPFGERKQLRKGVLDSLARELGIHRSEVGACMKFAMIYNTEEKLSTVIESYKSWSAIKQHALTDTTRPKARRKTPLRRAFDLIENIAPETLLVAADLSLIDTLIETLRKFATTIKSAA